MSLEGGGAVLRRDGAKRAGAVLCRWNEKSARFEFKSTCVYLQRRHARPDGYRSEGHRLVYSCSFDEAAGTTPSFLDLRHPRTKGGGGYRSPSEGPMDSCFFMNHTITRTTSTAPASSSSTARCSGRRPSSM